MINKQTSARSSRRGRRWQRRKSREKKNKLDAEVARALLVFASGARARVVAHESLGTFGELETARAPN